MTPRPRRRSLPWIHRLLWIGVAVATAGTIDSHDPAVCGVYLAPSSIPGAGLGIFAGRDYVAGDVVTRGDLVVPVVDRPWHAALDQNDIFVWENYAWTGLSIPGGVEEGRVVSMASFGIGALPNCLLPLVNLEDSYTRLVSLEHRSTSPGAGASTPYYDRQGVAWRGIAAGSELFVDYGADYFASRPEDYPHGVAQVEDWEQADEVLRLWVQLNQGQDGTTAGNWFEDALTLTRQLGDLWRSQVLQSLPSPEESWDQVVDAVTLGISEWQRLFHYRHSIEWLEEHGDCVDWIRVGPSTLPHAGRGGFARRSFEKDQVVAPVPLIHLAHRDVLNMYPHPVDDEDYERGPQGDVQHEQLLLNYCLGHHQSTLLLCPYGVQTAVINHASPSSLEQPPNLRWEWNRDLSLRLDEWSTRHIGEWATTSEATGLVLNLVATREIAEGDELLVSYGDEWELAWQAHVASWKPKLERYEPAFALDQQIDLILPTVSEGSYSAKDVHMLCRTILLEYAGYDVDPIYVDPIVMDEDEMDELDVDEYLDNIVSCRVLERNWDEATEEYRYVAEIYKEVELEDECLDVMPVVVWNLPRDTFCFEDVWYSRDHWQPWSFRHDMRLPDHLMPDAWKNLV